MYRHTYAEINLENIESNVKKIIKLYSDYEYYFGVVKADCYGHDGLQTVKAIVNAGCNYLCVATLDEAVEIRRELKEIPILCLGVIDNSDIYVCKEQDITVTIPSLEYIRELEKLDEQILENLKIHLKINTGMNRLGIKEKEELQKVYKIAKDKKMDIEGIYTHIFEASNEEKYNIQIDNFRKIIDAIPKNEIRIIHTSASEAMSKYDKIEEVNGCRLGIIMYGFTDKKDLNLKSTFSLKSEVIQINELKSGETVGYNGIYKSLENEKIAVVSIRLCRWNYS